MFEWSDARYFLAVAETGSTLAAGRSLRVSQTTVARRIAAFEEALGLRLFERRRAGYVLTPSGEALIADARNLAAAARALADKAEAARRTAGGKVRLTAEPAIANELLPHILGELREASPDLLVEVDATEEVRDLEAGAADVAIRGRPREDEAGLFGRRITEDFWAVYCSRAYAENRSAPRNIRELAGHPLISVGGAGEVGRYYAMWLREYGLERAVAMQHGSITGLLSAVRAGLGVGALPCLIAEADEALVRCMPAAAYAGRDIWLLCHERQRGEPRVRAVMELLGDRLRRHADHVRERLLSVEPAMPPAVSRAGSRQAAAGA